MACDVVEKNIPFKAIIAFSGKKTINGIDYTEAGLNSFPETETIERFDGKEYRLLVVANKYLTGFDQPKLCAMYIDKKLFNSVDLSTYGLEWTQLCHAIGLDDSETEVEP